MRKNLRTAFTTRQYMISKDFEIYYYDDKVSKSLNNHTHNYYEFYFFIAGDVSLEIDGSSYSCMPGDMFLIPPKVKHHAEILDSSLSYKRFVFWISEEYFNDLLKTSDAYAYVIHRALKKQYTYHFDTFAFNSIQSKIFNLIEELHSNRFGKNTKTTLCVCDLLLSINRYIYEYDNPYMPKEDHDLCENLIAYIEDHLDGDLSLSSLSNKFFVSPYYISHVIKQHLGISLHQYIMKKRLLISRDAILSNMPISKVYIMCGFRDYSSFFRAFKKEYGYSPKEYKKQCVEIYHSKTEGTLVKD